MPSPTAPSIRYLVVLLALLTPVLITSAHATESVTPVYEAFGSSPSTPFSRPLGIFFDTNRDECYVADTGNHQIVVLDENGMPLYRFYHNVTRDGQTTPGEPACIVVDKSGRIFVTDATVPYLDVLNFRGDLIQRIDPPQGDCENPDRFDRLAIGADNQVYATLACDRRVAVIGDDLTIERVFHLDSRGDDRSCITGIALGPKGRVFVADPCGTEMIRIYDDKGRYERGFGAHEAGFENFSFPSAIDVMPNGQIWVVDSIRQIVSRFTEEGEFLTYLGGKGEGMGAFNYPSSLSTDGENRLFVVERGGNRYQCFRFE